MLLNAEIEGVLAGQESFFRCGEQDGEVLVGVGGAEVFDAGDGSAVLLHDLHCNRTGSGANLAYKS